jgi:hypothetical protein
VGRTKNVPEDTHHEAVVKGLGQRGTIYININQINAFIVLPCFPIGVLATIGSGQRRRLLCHKLLTQNSR